MTTNGPRAVLGWALLFGMLWAPASAAGTPASPDLLPSELLPSELLRPDLERFEPAVREQLARLHDEALESADGETDGASAAESYGRLGETYLAYELPQEAESALAAASAADPHEPRWPYLRALAALGRGDLEAAAGHFDRVLELLSDPREAGPLQTGHLQTLLRSAANLVDLGRLDEAEARYDAAASALAGLDRPGMEAEVAFGRGRVAAERGRFPEAAAHFRRALEALPAADGVYYHLARALHRAGDTEAARKAMARRGETLPFYRDPWRDAVERRAAGVQVDLLRGLKALKAGRLDEAEASLRRAADAAPDEVDALQGLARVHELRREFGAAEALYRRALTVEEDPRALLNLGALVARRADPASQAEALALFRRAVEIDPRRPEAIYNLALALARGGRCAEAGSLLEGALTRIAPGEPSRDALAGLLDQVLAACAG